jgi:prolyl-tRNA synthetase
VVEAAEQLCGALESSGLQVLYDDRDASPGVKFADADLLGMPVQLVVGAKGVGRGVVEVKVRATGDRDELPLHDTTAIATAVMGR